MIFHEDINALPLASPGPSMKMSVISQFEEHIDTIRALASPEALDDERVRYIFCGNEL